MTAGRVGTTGCAGVAGRPLELGEGWVAQVLVPVMPLLFDLTSELADVANVVEVEASYRLERAIVGIDQVLGDLMALRNLAT